MDRYERTLEVKVDSLWKTVSKVMAMHTCFVDEFLKLNLELDDMGKHIAKLNRKEMRSPFINNLMDLRWQIEDIQKFLEMKRGGPNV
jgi:hypothetical protein